MKTKIIFFGTPNFAVGILDEVQKSKFTVVAVVTSVDKKSGRGRKIKSSAVKNYCLTNEIKLYQPKSLIDKVFISKLRIHKADIFIVVAFRMIPKVVWSIPKKGTFNLHASLLPNYRGAAPINWVLINQEKMTGLTTFFIDEKIDTGEILLKKECKIKNNETFDSLHEELLKLGKDLVINTIIGLTSNVLLPIKQANPKYLKIAPKLNKESTKINWNQPMNQIVSFINGLNSYPGAWSEINDNGLVNIFKIYNCRLEYSDHNVKINDLIVENKQIKISHKEGFLIIESLKLPGKKQLTSIELLNGYCFDTGVFVS
ncbi:MAG: methionyl-tRNA formyltransferase [Flavobacteriaceae bacterium]|nr:methionyl-tRNA formyltransferase [Flavobacteriaceae bacterium]